MGYGYWGTEWNMREWRKQADLDRRRAEMGMFLREMGMPSPAPALKKEEVFGSLLEELRYKIDKEWLGSLNLKP